MKHNVLVMDDDASLCRLYTLLLNRFGYDADTVQSGEEALTLYKQNMKAGTPYLAVILDLKVQSDMGGVEVLHELLALDPTVYAIVSSGISADKTRSTYKAQGFRDILPKPFRPHELAECLKRLPDATA